MWSLNTYSGSRTHKICCSDTMRVGIVFYMVPSPWDLHSGPSQCLRRATCFTTCGLKWMSQDRGKGNAWPSIPSRYWQHHYRQLSWLVDWMRLIAEMALPHSPCTELCGRRQLSWLPAGSIMATSCGGGGGGPQDSTTALLAPHSSSVFFTIEKQMCSLSRSCWYLYIRNRCSYWVVEEEDDEDDRGELY